MNCKFSIIVPVYNVEEYLDRCLESIVNQTYKNFEIILIDDGSQDNCPKICDEWAIKDKRIKVIHKENGGVSSARNAGLELITGEYVLFIDSDDWIKNDALTIIYENIDDSVEAIVFNHIKVKEDSTEIASNLEKQTIIGRDNIIRALVSDDLGWTGCCNKVYKRVIIEKNKIRFDIGLTIGEDYFFNYEYLNKTNCLSIIEDSLYYYDLTRENSAMHIKNYNYYYRWKVTERILLNELDSNEIYSFVFNRLINELYICSCEAALNNEAHRFYKDLIRIIRKYLRIYPKGLECSKKIIAISIFPKLYNKSLKIKNRLLKRG